ncbi:hypothetical protein ACFQVA_02440 [Actinomadura keratinilytica]
MTRPWWCWPTPRSPSASRPARASPDGSPSSPRTCVHPRSRAPLAAAGELAARIGAAVAGREAVLWTHSPADNREARARLGRDTVRAAHGLPVRHAVGHSPYLQVISDEDVPLTPELAQAKREFVNRHGQELLASGSPQYRIDTARVPASERFFRSEPAEADRLYALLASLGDDAAEVDDPGSSPPPLRTGPAGRHPRLDRPPLRARNGTSGRG